MDSKSSLMAESNLALDPEDHPVLYAIRDCLLLRRGRHPVRFTSYRGPEVEIPAPVRFSGPLR